MKIRSLSLNKKTVTFACEVEATNTFQRIARSLPKFLIILVELMYFVMLSKVFRKRTCKHESKGKSSDDIAIILIG